MNSRVRLIICLVGLAAFVVLILQAGLQGLVSTLEHTGWAFLLIVAIWGAVYVSNTVAWTLLIQAVGARTGKDGAHASIPFLRAYLITVSSFALNYATPFVALGGEPVKVAAAAQWIGTDRAASSVVSFRIAHTLGQVIFWLIAIPIGWVMLPHTVPTRIVLVVAAAVFVAAMFMLISLFRHGFVVRALRTIGRLPLLGRLRPRIEKLQPTLEHIDSQLAVLTDDERPRLIGAVIAEVIGRSLAMLEFYVIAHVEGLAIGYPTAFFIGAFSQLAIIIMIVIPFELGSREGGLAAVYQLLGLPPALGVYAGVVSRLRELVWIGIGLTLVWGMKQRGAQQNEPATR